MTGSAGAARLLVDNSVWSRTRHPAIASVWADAIEQQRIVACAPFLLEAGYSARSGDDLRRITRVVGASMDAVTCDAETWDIALQAQLAMADAAGLTHRRKPLDFLVAATAHQHGLGVLHYDHDYDLIAEHGGLDFASVWVVPRGTLEG